jgi:hypothetical protein
MAVPPLWHDDWTARGVVITNDGNMPLLEASEIVLDSSDTVEVTTGDDVTGEDTEGEGGLGHTRCANRKTEIIRHSVLPGRRLSDQHNNKHNFQLYPAPINRDVASLFALRRNTGKVRLAFPFSCQ